MFAVNEQFTGLADIVTANSSAIDDLLRRVCAEYAEMPGLRVTCQQAQRLWGLDAATCGLVLDRLLDLKFLTVTPSGQYARRTDGAPTGPDLRMAKAALDAGARSRQGDRRTG